MSSVTLYPNTVLRVLIRDWQARARDGSADGDDVLGNDRPAPASSSSSSSAKSSADAQAKIAALEKELRLTRLVVAEKERQLDDVRLAEQRKRSALDDELGALRRQVEQLTRDAQRSATLLRNTETQLVSVLGALRGGGGVGSDW